MIDAEFVDLLRSELGIDTVLCDAAGPNTIVVRPRTKEQVSQLLRLCNTHRQPVVPLGGKTSMTRAVELGCGELGLSLELLRHVGDVDQHSLMITVGPGAVLQTVQEAAANEGLYFPVDIGARGSATIGGMISTNAGGNHVVRYGMMRSSVVAIEVVLADGTVLPLQPKCIKNNAGYDLKHLFIGTEGTLGVVTEAVLRLYPLPTSRDCAWIATDSFDHLVTFLRFLEGRLGGTLSAFEVMWRDYYEFMTGPRTPHRPPVAHGYKYYALVESLTGGMNQKADGFESGLAQALEEGMISDAVISKSEKDTEEMWAVRDDVGQVFQLGKPWSFDLSLPIAAIEAYVEAVRRDLKAEWPDHILMVFGHLGDGNIHLSVTLGDGQQSDRERVEGIVYGHIASQRGSISAEHGIGIEKKNYLSYTRSGAELQVMRQLKLLLDANRILNPGRVLD